jgi:HK97 gp10 family phage protein
MAASLQSRLPAISAELRPRISAAIKAGAEAVAETEAELLPRSDNEPHIADRVTVVRSGPAEYRVVVGDDELYYGWFLEAGTVYMEAQPTLVPALDIEQEAIVAGATAVLKAL